MKNQMNVLSSGEDIFLVKFYGFSNAIFFSAYQREVLGNLIKKHGENGIEWIKRHQSNGDFDKASKETLKAVFSHDTHSYIELQKCGYIKA